MTLNALGGELVELRTADCTDLQGLLYRPTGQHRRAVLFAGGLGGLRLRHSSHSRRC
jgi:hypothetical protein